MTRRNGLLAAAVALASLAPLVYLAVLSASRAGEAPRLLPAEIRFDAWRAFLAGGALLPSLALSLALALGVAAVSTALGFVTARFVAYHKRRRTLLLLAYLPFVASPVVLGTCLLAFYLRAGLAGTLPGVALAHTVFTFGFSIVTFTGFWNREKLDFEDLAATLGADRMETFRRVILPISRGALRAGFFQAFLLSWFQYGLTLLIGRGRVETLPVLVLAYLGEANPLFAAAGALLLVLPPLVLMWASGRPSWRPV